MKDNTSPEEKLLRLIRGQKKQAPVKDKEPRHPIPVTAADLKKPPLFFSLRRFLPSLSAKRLILAGFVFSCIYLANSFIYPWFSFKKNRFSENAPQKIDLSGLEAGQEIRPYEFYLEGVKNKKIFSTTSEEETGKTSGFGNSDLIKDINLLGIIAGENPQAVIEDKKEQKTYYLTEGDYLGAFQVKDIQEGKVILSYGGKNYELHI